VKQFKRICLIVGILWLVTQVILLGTVTYLVSKTLSSKSIPEITHNLQAARSLMDWSERGIYYPHILQSGVTVGLSAINLLNDVKIVGISSLAGTETEWQTFETLFGETEHFQQQLRVLQTQLFNQRLIKNLSLNDLIVRINQVDAGISQVLSLKNAIKEAFGFNGKKHVVVLTQNNMELWPTGGYLGSYAEFYVENGAVRNLMFQDIGVPNGEVKGYVKAPEPISQYVHLGGTPGWRLRESNWNPDFPEGAKAIEWFFTEGKVEPIDTLVAINLIPVADLLELVEPLPIDDYGILITKANFYLETQKHTSYAFFDGSTQKRDFLSSFGKRLLETLMDRVQTSGIDMARVITTNLQNKQILVTTKEPQLAALLHTAGWDGSLSQPACPAENPNCLSDFLHINETNVGINKTNCCIDRNLSDEIEILPTVIRHHITMTYINHNPAKPEPPLTWGGGYKVYERLYVPIGSTLVSILENGVAIKTGLIDKSIYADKQVFGFLGLIEGGQTGTYEILYDVPKSGSGQYQLRLVKQSGIDSVPWTITIHREANNFARPILLRQDQWIGE